MPTSRREFFRGVLGLSGAMAGAWIGRDQLILPKLVPQSLPTEETSGYAVQQAIQTSRLAYYNPLISASVYIPDYHLNLLNRLHTPGTSKWKFKDGEWRSASEE